MRNSILVSILAFIAGCAGSVLLWQFWTPRCNESCPERIALSMLGFVICFPFLCSGAGLVVTAKRYEIWLKSVLFVLFMGSSSAIIILLTYLAR